MIYKGKLPEAVVGEMKHVINNALSVIFLHSDTLSPENYISGGEEIMKAARAIRAYVASLETKENFNSNPFEKGKTE